MKIKTTSKIINNIHPLTLNMGEVQLFTRSFSDEIVKDRSIFKVSTLKPRTESKISGTTLRLKTYLENNSFYKETINKMLMRKYN